VLALGKNRIGVQMQFEILNKVGRYIFVGLRFPSHCFGTTSDGLTDSTNTGVIIKDDLVEANLLTFPCSLYTTAVGTLSLYN
jgi:hypothetical protein